MGRLSAPVKTMFWGGMCFFYFNRVENVAFVVIFTPVAKLIVKPFYFLETRNYQQNSNIPKQLNEIKKLKQPRVSKYVYLSKSYV